MAGLIRGCALALLTAATSWSQDTAQPKDAAKVEAQPNPKPEKPGRSVGPGQSPEFRDVRKAIDALTPEQRQRFVENFKRWATLPPEERDALANREGLRRRKIEEEVSNALSTAGLDLSGDRRIQFAKRYVEQRRKIEEQLRHEMEEKRQPMLQALIEKLRAEFAPADPPASP